MSLHRFWYLGQPPQPCCSSCFQTLITMWELLLCTVMAKDLLSVMQERHVRTRAGVFWPDVLWHSSSETHRCFQQKCKNTFFFLFLCSVPRSAPRNLRVYDPTTTTLSVSWDHADGPVMQYRITYAQITGDPIEEYVSIFIIRQR